MPRVLIVDDSAVARAVIARAVEANRQFVVTGAVPHVNAALRFLATARVEVILLDLEMPGVDGLTALPDLIAAGRGARVLVISSTCGDGAAATVRALALGAADTLLKPGAGAPHARFADLLAAKLDRLTRPEPPITPAAARPAAPRPSQACYDVVAVGASTGGIHALSQLLGALPPTFQLPILITQHLPASFMPYFAAQVAVLAKRPCDIAIDRLRLRAGRVVIAPGDAHVRCIALADGTVAVRLSTAPSASGCLPSVDPMFESLVTAYGPRALAVVLSGMGRDGAEGARLVAEAGGTVVVQDEASSVVWGMPGAVAAAGHAQAMLPPDEIGRLIASRRRPA